MGFGFPDLMPERDGIASGMLLLEMLATERVSVNELLRRLEKQFGPHHYARLDTHFPLEKRAALMEMCKSQPPSKLAGSPVVNIKVVRRGEIHRARRRVADAARLRHRADFCRIYAEAPTMAAAEQLIRDGVGIIAKSEVKSDFHLLLRKLLSGLARAGGAAQPKIHAAGYRQDAGPVVCARKKFAA